ncbi:TetR/AcrR family transcriptional regulator [Marinococcus sp. PL1-022]|uniref:TetR/AcrR family transcriptional regulator n=1 Tax=Marinococcus sp. PL1-022 TaxID=3095363 RepID=UPI0029C2CFF2|nr:TetR/AcrR family transcriptional regulator [Marinococcus sp. PL1-022]MDX6154530.1 TetR/AcrR family transcriptional regulator [Marinococcus sp. PL1-022]
MENTKLTKRKQQAIQTKQTIYNAALTLIQHKSFDEVTIEEISKKADVSVGSFYYYFHSKEDIYLSMFKKLDEELFRDFNPEDYQQAGEDLLISFFLQLARHVSALGLNIVKYSLFKEGPVPYYKDLYMSEALQKIIKIGQAKNIFASSMSEEEMTEYLLIIMQGIMLDWCKTDEGYSLEEKTEQFMSRVILSIQH